MEIVSLKNVSFTSQNIKIIQNASISVEEGAAVALVGASGCGKSSLLKLCAGLIIPTEGEVYYKEKNIFAMNRAENLEFRRESGFVFQDSALWANQSLRQCLELPLRIHFPEMTAKERQRRIDKVINSVGYKKSLDIRPSSLSSGEQKLIGFSRAMLCSPKLLFLDEFTESLDDYTAQRLASLVKQEKLNNNTIIFIDNNMAIIRSLADYVIMVVGGQIYTRMTIEQINSDRDLSDLLEKGI